MHLVPCVVLDGEALRLHGRADPEVAARVLDFVRGRLRVSWAEQHPPDVVEAVLAAGWDDLVGAHRRLAALSAHIGRPDFTAAASAFKRAASIVRRSGLRTAGDPQADLLSEDAERALHRAWLAARARVGELEAAGDVAGVLAEMSRLKPAVDRFFDCVRVMVDDPDVAANRIRLLDRVAGLFRRVADFSKIHTTGTG